MGGDYEIYSTDQHKWIGELNHEFKNQKSKFQTTSCKIFSVWIYLRKVVVYITPSCAIWLVINSKNSSPDINFFFIFLSKPIKILGNSDMSFPSSTESISGGCSLFNLHLGLGENPQNIGHAKHSLGGFWRKLSQKLKHMRIWLNVWWYI